MESLRKFIFLTLLCMCLGVGIVVGQDDDDEPEGDLKSAAEAPIRIRPGKPLSLTCNLTNIADDSKVEWVKDGESDNILKTDDTYTIYDTNSTLLIRKAEQDDSGTYECKAISKPGFTKQFSVFFFQLTRMPKSLVVTEAGVIELKCLASGKPIPTVQWLKDGKKLNDSKYALAQNENTIANAELSFENAQQEDRGLYTCQIFSDIGVYNTSTYVRVKSVYAPLYPLIGIILEIVVLAIVIIFFERRRAKQEYEESDTDQGPDMKNTSESHDSTVRQRK